MHIKTAKTMTLQLWAYMHDHTLPKVWVFSYERACLIILFELACMIILFLKYNSSDYERACLIILNLKYDSSVMSGHDWSYSTLSMTPLLWACMLDHTLPKVWLLCYERACLIILYLNNEYFNKYFRTIIKLDGKKNYVESWNCFYNCLYI